MRKTGKEVGQSDHRLLKDKVYRALSGRALTPSTLGLFAAAFLFDDEDTRYLWALFLRTTIDEARAAFQSPGIRIDRLIETHEVNSEGRSQFHRVCLEIAATRDDVTRFPLRFDSAALEVTVSVGEIGDIYKCSDELFAVDVLLPRALIKNELFRFDYSVEYLADAKADPEFLRGAVGKQIDSATIEVKFSPARPPSAVWWMVLSGLGSSGRTVYRERIDLDHRRLSVCKTVTSVDDAVIGFRWEW